MHLISPGSVFTDMARIARPDLTGEGRILPEDIAEIAAFLPLHRTNAVIDEIAVHRAGKEPFLSPKASAEKFRRRFLGNL